MKRRTLPLLACTLAVLAAACSSSNAASIPPPRYVEKSAAIAAGDGVCTALAADRQKLLDDFRTKVPQPTIEDAQAFLVNTVTPRMDQAVGDFHRVGEPTKDRPAWDALVVHLDTDLLYFKAMIRSDPMSLLTTNPFEREAARFQAYGFKTCGTPAT